MRLADFMELEMNLRHCLGAAAVAFGMLAGSGCVTSTVSHLPPAEGQKSSTGVPVVGNLSGSISGIYLFNLIPLWSGSPSRPNRNDYDMFVDHVRKPYLLQMLDNRARQLDGDGMADAVCREHSTGAFTLWLFWKRTISGTAVAVRKP